MYIFKQQYEDGNRISTGSSYLPLPFFVLEQHYKKEKGFSILRHVVAIDNSSLGEDASTCANGHDPGCLVHTLLDFFNDLVLASVQTGADA